MDPTKIVRLTQLAIQIAAAVFQIIALFKGGFNVPTPPVAHDGTAPQSGDGPAGIAVPPGPADAGPHTPGTRPRHQAARIFEPDMGGEAG